ncbi:MAG: nitroreductase family protein [Nanoarchaeota archaeon]|nr:nitroreductase family protein [Nanoarchaeota archaeon]MBU1005790.1 nitroreductase family protein [Nanoarchaeota archaeon]MBU1946578.1 nitroreductase family protein [Nanoarchaeota archaeon]
METLECIRTRRSIRKYKDKDVEWDKVVQILDAGRFAPSAGNIQNWKFVAVREEGVRKKLAQAAFDQQWMEEVPVHIVIAGEPEKADRFYGSRGERLYTIQNCAAVIENMMLAANDLGLGSCWIGAFDEYKVKRAVGIPDDVSVQAILTIGYADEKPEMPSRKALEHIVYLDRWFNKGQGHKARGYKSVVIKDAIEKTKKAVKKIAKKITK